jgi:hypothetical protein
MSGLELSEDDFFLIEGEISELQTGKSSVNLLESIKGRSGLRNLSVGAVATLAEMHGVVANSASLSLHENEEIFNFAGIVDGKIVCGSFSTADKIKNGDVLKLVVSIRKEAYFVHGLLRADDSLLMLPLMVFAGRRSLFKGCMKVALRLCMLIWIVSFSCIYFMSETGFSLSVKSINLCLFLILVPVFLCYPSEYMTYRTVKLYGIYASKIFSVFKFPRPDDLDVRPGMSSYRDGNYGFDGINCKLALDAHRRKFNIVNSKQ